MSPLATLTPHGAIAVLRIDHPPVNALCSDTVAALDAAFTRFEAEATPRALVIACAGRSFVAGGDIAAFEKPDFTAAPFNDLLARIERSVRPVVAALHGTALGGGLELALACHARVADPATRLGLPEVKLGLIPGSLGTQRLPRLIGVERALELMQTGRMVGAAEALRIGLVDLLAEGDLLAAASALAVERAADAGAVRRTGSLTAAPPAPDVWQRAEAEAARKPSYPALAAVVRCVRAAVERPFAEGAVLEAREFEALRRSAASRALRHLFFAEREAAKVPGLPKDLALRPLRSAGVVGAGTMGGGIAMTFVNAGIPTLLVDASDEALQRGLGTIRRTYEQAVAKGRMTAAQLDERLSLLRGTTDPAPLAECDLLVEAVYEDLALKQRLCAQIGAIAKPGAILATNTSTLDVDLLARASGRPADFLGMHFFSPAHVMRLLEVVRGRETAPDALATVMNLARRIGKVAVVSGVCWGFIGNRMLEPYLREAEALLLEGATPERIDTVVQRIGLAMGPCRMLDMAGLDVGAKVVLERAKAGALPDDPGYRAMVCALHERGRLGQKSGAGYYRYDGRTALPDPAVDELARELAARHGIARRDDIGDDEIVERLLYPLIDEGLRVLEEGIAYRAGDIDVVWTAGYGFPEVEGGPLFMAERIGLGVVAERLAFHGRTRGNPHGYWTPSSLLTELARSGATLAQRAGTSRLAKEPS